MGGEEENYENGYTESGVCVGREIGEGNVRRDWEGEEYKGQGEGGKESGR